MALTSALELPNVQMSEAEHAHYVLMNEREQWEEYKRKMLIRVKEAARLLEERNNAEYLDVWAILMDVVNNK